MTAAPVPSSAAPVLALGGVTVRTPAGDVLLDRVDWTVACGQRWVVLGANGAGKTTLVQVAATLRPPTRGTAVVLGHRIGRVDVRDLRRRIGYASAELERLLDDRVTVADVVLTARHGMLRPWRESYDEADRERAARLLADVGLDGAGQRAFGSLSAGERRRAQLARSLMSRPELLLLDEPTAGLDLPGRERLVDTLAHLAGRDDPRGLVFVTHHCEEIPPGFTHALLLRRGRVLAAGRLDAAVTAETLSDCFDLPVSLRVEAGRYWARKA